MNSLKNKVQLIGNVGQDPEIIILEGGKKVTRFSMATNQYYKNDKGEKTQITYWHNMVAWGKIAEVISTYALKGKEIAIQGKLVSRNYENGQGEKRTITEVVISEVLFLGSKKDAETE